MNNHSYVNTIFLWGGIIMTERILLLDGLDCASCAGKIEDLAGKVDGVNSSSLDFVSKKLKLKIDEDKQNLAIDKIKDIVKDLEPDVVVREEKTSLRKVLVLDGLDCASCAEKIENLAGKVDGVNSSSLDFVSKKLKLDIDKKKEVSAIREIKAIVKELEPDVVVREEGRSDSQVLVLEGLNCSSCAEKIENLSKKVDGVEFSSLDFVSKKFSLKLVPGKEKKALKEIKAIINELEPDVEILSQAEARARNVQANTATCDGTCDIGEEKKSGLIERFKDATKNESFMKILIASVLFFLPIIFKIDGPARVVIYGIAYLTVGLEIIVRAFRNVRAGQPFDEYFLMTIATAGAFIIGEYPEGVAVMLLYQIGEYLQGLAVNHSRKSITSLMDIRPDYANLEEDGETIVVDPSNVHIGDYIIIRPGEKVPLDGVLVEGESFLDTSNITGESVPRKVVKGDQILSGSINQEGLLKVQVTKEFEDSTVSKVLDLVENASSKKAPTENFITKFARYYTPVVVLTAIVIGLIIPLVFSYSIKDWAYRAFVFLVISCPCALVISIPLGFFGGIGGASKEGILIKGGNYLEGLNDVDTLVFDKTGTITKGNFEVSQIDSYGGLSQEEILEIGAYGEFYSNHPIGKSIVSKYDKEIDESRIKDYKEISGKGIEVLIDGKKVLLGNAKLLEDNNIEVEETKAIGTIAYIAREGKHIGTIVVSDTLKENVIEDISRLKARGIKRTIMLSGDNEKTALAVGEQVGIDEAYGNLLPQDKVEKFESILEESDKKVAFIGDGVNDAPALARADIGIAMGGLGSDAAIEASDIVIMTDEIGKINTALGIASKTKKIVTQNIYLALGVKLIVLVLGALGKANMWMAVFADVGVSILAIFNSIRALKVED